VALNFLTAATANAAMDAIVAASTNMKISLHVATPVAGSVLTGTGEEVGTGYSKQTGQFTAAVNGAKTGPNSAVSYAATGWTASAPLGWFVVWESTGTTPLCGGALSATLQPPPNCTVVILAAGLSLSVAG
jgi:hypothetical protein